MFVRVPPHRGESRDAVAIVLLPPQSVSWSLWGFVTAGWGQRGAQRLQEPGARDATDRIIYYVAKLRQLVCSRGVKDTQSYPLLPGACCPTLTYYPPRQR